MFSPAATSDFYRHLPVFRDFTQVADEAYFKPLPDDWIVGVADVQQSTKAIRENRYKAVNMAGAAVIAPNGKLFDFHNRIRITNVPGYVADFVVVVAASAAPFKEMVKVQNYHRVSAHPGPTHSPPNV